MRTPRGMTLPPTWVWTRRAYGPNRCLFAARDTRWEPSVPDVVDVGASLVIAYARECDKAVQS